LPSVTTGKKEAEKRIANKDELDSGFLGTQVVGRDSFSAPDALPPFFVVGR